MSAQKRDSIEWCEMMIQHSSLTDCKPMLAQIAEELRQLRAAAKIPREPTETMIDAGLSATNGWLRIGGSAATVNREKMRIRYKAMIGVAS